MIAPAAAKGRRVFLLAAVCLLSALLLAPTAEALRNLPNPLAPALTSPAMPADILQDEAAEAQPRLRLFADLSLPERPIGLVQAQKTASGVFSLGIQSNIRQTGGLGQNRSGPSFQGLWTDPVTGISYARNRWYDARTASWLSEDPMGAVDSPNLYAFVGWGPHRGRDPMGTCTVFDGGMAVVTTSSVPCSEVVSGAALSLVSASQRGLAWTAQALLSAFREPERIGEELGETVRATALDPTIPARIVDETIKQGLEAAVYVTKTAPDVMLADATNQIGSTLSDPDKAGRAAFHLGLFAFSAVAERAALASSSAGRLVSSTAGNAKPVSPSLVYRNRPSALGEHGVFFVGDDLLPALNRTDATLGREGHSTFFMPIEDSASIRTVGDAARESGMAPSITRAYVEGGDAYGVSFPLQGLSVRSATAADAGGFEHFLGGGHTAVRLAGPNGGFQLNLTREFVTPGGAPMPRGSVLFKLGEAGEWMPVRRY